MPMNPRTLRPSRGVPTFSEKGYARVWALTNKSSGSVSGAVETDSGQYAVRWWDGTTQTHASGDSFGKAAAGGARAVEIYPCITQQTSLLLHFDGANGSTAFVDSSPESQTLSVQGSPEISTAQSVFGGSSGYFDGASYLEVQGSPDFWLHDLDFTIEARVRLATLDGGLRTICAVWNQYQEYAWLLCYDAAGQQLQLYTAEDGAIGAAISRSWSPSAGQWYHVAAVRANGVLKLYVDGVALGASEALPQVIFSSPGPLTVGAAGLDGHLFEGHIDELRVTRGVAIYTADFTPPAAPLAAMQPVVLPSGQFDGFDISGNAIKAVRAEGVSVDASSGYTQTYHPYNYIPGVNEVADVSQNALTSQALNQFYSDLLAGSGTLDVSGNPGIDGDDPTIATAKGYTVLGSVPPSTALLLHFDGANGSTAITNEGTSASPWTANGTAAISTAQSKFGGASAYCDSNGAYWSAPFDSSVATGSGDFTIECWVRRDAACANSGVFSAQYDGTAVPFVIGFGDNTNDHRLTGGIYAGGSGWTFVRDSSDLPLNTWAHVAFVRDGNTLRLFVNGTEVDTAAFTEAAPTISGDMYIGRGWDGARQFRGFIDDLRFHNGEALYTSAFTPPSAPLEVYP